MALNTYDTIVPQGDYSAVNMEHVGMPVKPGESVITPGTYYQFGEVSELSVELGAGLTGSANEYVFEFIPKEGFTGLTISPEVRWLGDPQFPAQTDQTGDGSSAPCLFLPCQSGKTLIGIRSPELHNSVIVFMIRRQTEPLFQLGISRFRKNTKMNGTE